MSIIDNIRNFMNGKKQRQHQNLSGDAGWSTSDASMSTGTSHHTREAADNNNNKEFDAGNDTDSHSSDSSGDSGGGDGGGGD